MLFYRGYENCVSVEAPDSFTTKTVSASLA